MPSYLIGGESVEGSAAKYAMVNPAQPGIALDRKGARAFFNKIIDIYGDAADCNFKGQCALRG